MKKLFIFIFVFLLFIQTGFASQKKTSFASLSAGYSWFHNYSGFSENGMNFSINYEPALNRYFNIDNSFTLFIYSSVVAQNEFTRVTEKALFLSPQISIGPRCNLPLINEKLFLFFGSGISFSAGINYSPVTGKADADFSPGFYIRGGFDFVFTKHFGLGINSKYIWNMAHIPHIISLNLTLIFGY